MIDPNELPNNPFVRGLILRKVRQLVRNGFLPHEAEDLEQELMLALLDSLDGYDPSQCQHFNVFVTTVIERATAHLIRKRRTKKRTVRCQSLDQLLGSRPDHRLEEALGDDACETNLDWEIDFADFLKSLPQELTDLAVRLQFHSSGEVARQLGLSLTSIYQRRNRIRELLTARQGKKIPD